METGKRFASHSDEDITATVCFQIVVNAKQSGEMNSFLHFVLFEWEDRQLFTY